MEKDQDVRESLKGFPGGDVPIPPARPLAELGWEQVDDELVILDVDTLHYHTLNATATVIWLACDGKTTTVQLASDLRLPLEVVESTVAELGESGLLQSPSQRWDSTLSRRRAARLIAAGLIGAIGLPVVKSITVPDAASAASPSQCALGYIFTFRGICTFVCGAFSFLGCRCDSVTPGGGYCCICGGGQQLRAASGGIDPEAFYAKIAEYEKLNNPTASQVEYIEVDVDDDWEPVGEEPITDTGDSTDTSVSAPEQIEEFVETQPESEELPVEEAPAETVLEEPTQETEEESVPAEEGVDAAVEDSQEANG